MQIASKGGAFPPGNSIVFLHVLFYRSDILEVGIMRNQVEVFPTRNFLYIPLIALGSLGHWSKLAYMTGNIYIYPA